MAIDRCRSSRLILRTTGTSCSATRSKSWRGVTVHWCGRVRRCCRTKRRCAPRRGCTASSRRSFTFTPDRDSLWGQRYPDAAYHLVTSTPDVVDAIGGDELLDTDGDARSGTHAVFRTLPTQAFCFAVVGSLTDRTEAARMAANYEQQRDDRALLEPAKIFWTNVTHGWRITGERPESAAVDASLPWLAHDAIT